MTPLVRRFAAQGACVWVVVVVCGCVLGGMAVVDCALCFVPSQLMHADEKDWSRAIEASFHDGNDYRKVGWLLWQCVSATLSPVRTPSQGLSWQYGLADACHAAINDMVNCRVPNPCSSSPSSWWACC